MVTSRVLGLIIELRVLPVDLLYTLKLGVNRSFQCSVRVECGLKLLLRYRIIHHVFLIPLRFISQILIPLGGWDPFQGFQRGAPTFRGIEA